MTEAEWLTSDDPEKMLEFLTRKASQRKLRLYGCAVARLLPSRETPGDTCRRTWAIKMAERFAEGEVNRDALDRKWEASWTVSSPEAFDAALGARDACLQGRGGEMCLLLRCVFANPFRPVHFDPAWRTPDVLSLAQAAYQERRKKRLELDPERLAVLADALEEVGCSGPVLEHLRLDSPHVRGCWVLDLILGKE